MANSESPLSLGNYGFKVSSFVCNADDLIHGKARCFDLEKSGHRAYRFETIYMVLLFDIINFRKIDAGGR